MRQIPAYHIWPSGDNALTIDFGNVIDPGINRWVMVVNNALNKNPFNGFIETVPAYASLTVYYNLLQLVQLQKGSITVFDKIKNHVQKIIDRLVVNADSESPVTLVEIPVCYHPSLGADIITLGKIKNLSVQKIIDLHTAGRYQVYMTGFLPGFAYMGQVNDAIALPRKKTPVPVRAGSVGIAGRQTGIYPLHSPGGWHIIGCTPIAMFDAAAASPCYLKPGNIVQFKQIDLDEFNSYPNRLT